MTRPRLPKHVHAFVDRHGHARHYLRVPGKSAVPLPNPLEGWDAFMRAVEAARGDASEGARKPVRKSIPGSFDDLISRFYGSAEFVGLAPQTKITYRGIIERIRVAHGDKPVSHVTAKAVREGLARRAETPSAANNWLRMLRLLMRFAVAQGLRKDDPTEGVRPVKVRSAGFKTWSEADIAKFEARHPVGSRARLAFALGLYTGQRRGDVVKLGRQHISGNVLSLRQRKTGTEVIIPVHPELASVIEASTTGRLTFLVTSQGKPFDDAGFGNLFRQWCNEAGLNTGLSFHGLRKAAARRLAEAGATTREIASVTGHTSLREVERYTIAAERARLAQQGMAKVRRAFSGTRKDRQ